MSIETKYRPDDFKGVKGQVAVVRALENAIDKNLGRAFLFTGPSGTGKTTLARIAAKKLGCDVTNLQEVDGATKTGIDDMRAITEDLIYRPLSGGKKGIIVDEFHALSKQAVTSLLKAMEDPPAWVYWFICTTEMTKIPVTIKTRALAFQLKEVSEDNLLDILERTEEAKGVPDDVLLLCAEEAEGSPRQALSNLGVCAAAKTKKEARELLSSASEHPAAFELARLLLSGGSWSAARALLVSLKETNPESVRHVVRAYMTKVILEPKGKVDEESALAVLQAFSQPFNSSDGMSPLVLACAKLMLD